ncbi:response regulator [Gemmata sp. G18]|uniref:histidine kinase n=1 Tax=Gemmata palustris TaxID=2822762 RepID=A0ABS5BMY2_9BACT|nr:response regulator [Gemmata palustris]MBP3955094.1 response regulator [Gemmata palustris]
MAVELLLVEDDPAHVELCRRVLDRRADEYRVSVVEDLASARAWLRARAPDLVLADLRLPGGAATELLEDSGTFLPVVVMTSQGDQDRAVAAMKAGVLDYVVKSPEMFRTLPEIVDRALRSARHVRDRIAAEAGLKESEERFRQLAENIDAVFWLYEVAGARLIYVSAAWERVFGTPVAAPLADPSARLGCVHADDRDEFAAHLAAPDPARPRQTCYRVVTPGGLVRWIEERTFPIFGPGGTVHRVAGLATDVTARRALEAALQHSQKLDALGRLAGGIAHDFNNMLGVISGYAGLIIGDARGGAVAPHAVQIQAAGDRAATLTRQLLAFSRNQVIAPVRLNLNQVLADLQQMFDRLIGSGTRIDFRPAAKLGDIRGDVGQIEQVAMNLVVNARDAMPSGGRITITTGDTDVLPGEPFGGADPPPGRYVQLTVEDTGCGMSSEVMARAFEPFFTTKGVGKGTGLGLATVYGIVKQGDGHIQIQSAPGAGTRFDILFPRAGDSKPDGDAPAQPAAPVRGGTEVVLLAEDDAQLREFLVRALTDLGYTIVPATDGEEALSAAADRGGAIDLLLSDVQMPRMTGSALALRFRSLYPAAGVVLVSGYAPEESRARLAALADALVPKPFTIAHLATRLREVLDRRAIRK